MGPSESSASGQGRSQQARRSSHDERGRLLLKLALVVIAILFLTRTALSVQPEGKERTEGRPSFASDEVLVVADADANANGTIEASENFEGLEANVKGKIVRKIKLGKARQVLRVKLPPGKSVKNAIGENWKGKDRRIVSVEPNYAVSAQLTPNDPRFSELWGLNNTGQTGGTAGADIDAPQAWDTTTGSSAVVVAVIDTGVDYLHPELSGNMWRNPGETGSGRENNGVDDDANGFVDDVYGWDFVDEDNDPIDAHSHGTHVSGTIAARGNNGVGVVGVNWQCRIMACRFLDASGSGWTSDAVEAVNYAVANGAKVLNNSWGGGGYSSALEAAIAYARQQGVLFVAAAGNAGTDADQYPMYPAAYPDSNIVSVASTDHNDELSYFSNWGATSVDVAAPGSSILSSVPVYADLFLEHFQGASTPGFGGTQMTLEGPANFWGTVETNTGWAGNKAARGDWSHFSPYRGDSDGAMLTPAMDTRNLHGVCLQFQYRYEIGGSDLLAVDVWDGSTWQNVFARNNTGSFWDGYYFIRIELDAYRNAAMRIRFRWLTDSYDNGYYGAEIDDIRVQHIGGNYSSAYAVYSGTSMATPHVSGVAALILAQNPGISVSELKARLLRTGTPLSVLAGRTVSGRRINAYNALHPTPGLVLDSPNGGERWSLGGIQLIRWSSIAGGSTVDIDLMKGGSVLTRLAEDAPNDGEYIWSVSPSLTVGADYRIRITDGSRTDTSDAFFQLFEYNDDCTQAICLTDGTAFEGTTVGAGGTDNSSCAYYDAFDVWHEYTPVTNGQVTITTDGSPFDTTLAVYDACGGAELACNDDYYTLQAYIQMQMNAGRTYLIRVAGYGGATGPYRILVSGGGGECDANRPVHNVTQNRSYSTIQAAIDESNNGDEIVLDPGTYTGTGNRDLDFSHGLEQEGQTRTITIRSVDPADPAMVAATVIDGGATQTDPHRAFIFESAEGPDCIVDGLTIRGCLVVNGTDNAAGGAMIISGCYPTIRRCVFEGNHSDYWGGGVAVFGGGPAFDRCSFSNNSALDTGGGLYLMNTVPVISCCRFLDNTAVAGAGIYIIGVEAEITPRIINSIFGGNLASARGGAIRNNLYASPIVSNCTFVHNASIDTGGINNSPDAHPVITNCVFWENRDETGAGERSQINLGLGTPTVSYCLVQGWTGTYAGTGNFDADPLFVDIDGPDNSQSTWADNDLHLQAGSPCVNAGDPGGDHTGQTDIDLEPRVQQQRVDIGADESPYFRDCDVSTPVWQNTSFAAQSGAFSVDYDAVPNGWNLDALTGLSAGAGSAFSSFAVLVRFNNTGTIDARDGGTYRADMPITYTPGVSYHFRLVVNVQTHRYSVYVSPAGGTQQTLASNYAFRTEQNGVTYLDNLGIFSDAGSHQVCEFRTEAAFTNIAAAIAQLGNSSADWGDYDNDGDLDLVISGYLWQWTPVPFPALTKLYRNDAGVFTDTNANLIAVQGGSCRWGDYDNDGDLDLVISGYGDSQQITQMYTNNGGSFTATSQSFAIYGSLASGDYDNDGDLDWAISGASSGNAVTAVFRNEGGGIFVDAGASLPAVNGLAAWGDYDRDGDLDLAIGGSGSSGIYRNNGDGSFTDINAGLPAANSPAFAWGDYDADGQLDLAYTSSNSAAVYRNNGGIFIAAPSYLPRVSMGWLSWGDCDQDGDLDVLLSGFSGSFACTSTIYRNHGAGVFADANPGFSDPYGLGGGVCAWGDYDTDGDLDIILAGDTPDTEAAESRIYRNDGSVVNVLPTVPSDLSATITGNSITFAWAAASDPQTPAPGLTYNLRVGTTPGGNEVSSGMAAGTGYRRVAAMGNVQHNLSWTLKGLPARTYYWSVQAVDAAWAGGPWAPEQVLDWPRVHNITRNTWHGTIQSAVDAASDGDVIVLGSGTYTGSGNRDVVFNNGLPAGKTRAVTIRSSDPTDPTVVAATIIDCQATAGDRHRAFKLVNGEGPSTTIAGLTIANGFAPQEGDQSSGGAILCSGVDATIANCVFSSNTAANWGGAMAIVGGAASGAGPIVRDCRFISNASQDVGGALHILNSRPEIGNCGFLANHSIASGGAVFIDSVDGAHIPTILNCVFDGNQAGLNGGAVRNANRASPVLRNCTMVNNHAVDGGGIHVSANAAPAVVNCIVWGNSDNGGTDESAQVSVGVGSPTVRYSCIQGLTAFAGNANIGAAPGLADIDGPDNDPSTWADNNLHLQFSSPCINAGDQAGSYAGQKDMDGGPRVQGGLVEIGADEWYPGDFDWNGKVNQADLDHFMACAWGPAIAPADPACADANLDRDPAGDVDVVDFAIFQRCWTGEAALAVGCVE